jgi:hypothetical protein
MRTVRAETVQALRPLVATDARASCPRVSRASTQ